MAEKSRVNELIDKGAAAAAAVVELEPTVVEVDVLLVLPQALAMRPAPITSTAMARLVCTGLDPPVCLGFPAALGAAGLPPF